MLGWSPLHDSRESQNRPKGPATRPIIPQVAVMANKLEFPDEAGNSVDNEAGNGAGPGEDVEAEGDLVWKLYRSALMRDQSVEPKAGASFPNVML